MQVVSCTCDVVHVLRMWFYVQMVLCTYCTHGIGLHVVLYSCHISCIAGMWYYVCALCSCGIVTCVLIVLYFVLYMYFLVL